MTDSRFSELYLKYRKDIFRVAYCCLGNIADAEDIMQECFVKLYSATVEFADENHIKAWLIKVAVNHCRNIKRQLTRRQPVQLDKNEAAPQTDDSRWLLEVIMRLKQKMRLTLYMYYYEGYSAKEIAALLGVKQTTVTTRLMRGRKELRELLEKEGYNGL